MRVKTWAVWIAAAVAVTGGGVAWRLWPVAVEIGKVTRGPVVEAIYATGTVEPGVMLPVAPRTTGRLVALLADEGAQVKRGQVLARVEAIDLEHTVQEMSARQRLAQQQYDRTRTLVDQKFLSAAELDRTHTELDAAQAALDRAQAQRDYNLLLAPADGTVLRRDGEIGQLLTVGQTVFTLSCCAPLRVSAEVDEEDISKVRLGQPVVLRGDALPGKIFDGSVAEITPKGDPVARSYRVRIRFTTPNLEASGLRVGMTMDANLITAQRVGALLVPNRAIQSDAVWVVDDGVVRRQLVHRGFVGNERTEILSGLAEGASVVLGPPEGLREGRRVRAAVVENAAPAAAVNGTSNSAANNAAGAH